MGGENGTKLVWTKTNKDNWRAELDGKVLFVWRSKSTKSWAVEPKFVCIGRKPRRYSSYTHVSGSVKIGNTSHRLTRPESGWTVTDAKRLVECYARTGKGAVTVTNLDD
jgi:hypothetical protein